jgi:hypothetical protein
MHSSRSGERNRMTKKQAKRKSSSEQPTPLHALSDDAPVHLPMAYENWLPIVVPKQPRKAKQTKGGKKASKRKGPA